MSKTIYYACKYAPLELFAGYGATFSALDPLAESFSCAERCAHANLCGYAKAVLEQVEQSGIRALVLTNCCDAMLRVYDVLAASGKMEFLQLLPVPHQSTPATRARFARDLRRLADALQRYTGQEFDAQRAHAFFVHKPHAEGPHLTLLGAHGGSVLYDTVQKAFALRCLPREVERNLWSQAEFDSVTAKKLCELRAKYWPDTVQLPPEQMGEVLRDLYSRGATIVSSEQGYGIYFRREDTLYFVEMMAENDRAAEVLMEAAREKEVIVEKAVITVGAAQNLFLGEGTRQEYGLIRFEGEPFDVSESYMRLMMD